MRTELDSVSLTNALRTRRLGRSVEVHPVVDSTMDLAREAGHRGAPDGHLVWADAQRAGRGTRGRRWSSPPNVDLYLSLLLRPKLALTSLPPITLAAGLAVREVIADLMKDAEVKIKWPNDVWVDRRKTAGLLVESSGQDAIPDAVIVGIGVNVNRRTLPPEIQGSATSIWLAKGGGEAIDRVQLLADLLARLEHWIDQLLMDGSAPIVAELRAHLALVGELAQLDGREGAVRGVDPEGALLFETKTGIIAAQSGRLFPLPRGGEPEQAIAKEGSSAQEGDHG